MLEKGKVEVAVERACHVVELGHVDAVKIRPRLECDVGQRPVADVTREVASTRILVVVDTVHAKQRASAALDGARDEITHANGSWSKVVFDITAHGTLSQQISVTVVGEVGVDQ